MSCHGWVDPLLMRRMKTDRSQWPALVRLGLWGISGRTGAWCFVWGMVFVGLGGLGYGLAEPRFLGVGVVGLVGALWYFLALRWVDRHGRW